MQVLHTTAALSLYIPLCVLFASGGALNIHDVAVKLARPLDKAKLNDDYDEEVNLPESLPMLMKERHLQGLDSAMQAYSTFFTDFQRRSGNTQVLYTIITGGYDKAPRCNPKFMNGTDIFLITDDPNLTGKGYVTVVMNQTAETNQILSRVFKLRPHTLFGSYRKSLYLDANLGITHPLDDFFSKVDVGKHDLAAYRCCGNVYDEAAYVADYMVRKNWATEEVARKQTKLQADRYSTKFPQLLDQFPGSIYGKVILRQDNEKTRNFGDCWYREFMEGAKRDQLSSHYCALEAALDVEFVEKRHNDSFTGWDPGFRRWFLYLGKHK